MAWLTRKSYKLYDIKDKLSRENFAHKFKLLVLQKGLTQRVLSEKVGITQQLMSHIIRSVRTGKKYRKKISQVLGIPEKEIWTWK